MKKVIIKIAITMFLILAVVITIVIFKKYQNKVVNTNGKITVIVENQNEEIVINKVISFKEGDNLLKLLNDNFQLRYETDMYGVVLYGINEIQTDWYTTYLAIYVDGVYSSRGISSITLVDGMKLKVVETKV